MPALSDLKRFDACIRFNGTENRMKCTEQLSRDHGAILKALEILRTTALGWRLKYAGAQEDCAALLGFLRTFADRCHHGKEEKALFPKLMQAGGTMRIVIGYDGSMCSDIAIKDLRMAGLPETAEVVVLSVTEVGLAPTRSYGGINVQFSSDWSRKLEIADSLAENACLRLQK